MVANVRAGLDGRADPIGAGKFRGVVRDGCELAGEEGRERSTPVGTFSGNLDGGGEVTGRPIGVRDGG
jgi:hypothetical protein